MFISITRAFQRYQNLAAPNFFKVRSQIWSYVLHNHLQKCNATSDITGGKTRENVLNRANFQTLVTFFPQVRQVEAIDMFIMKVNTCNGAKTALGILNSQSKPNSTRLRFLTVKPIFRHLNKLYGCKLIKPGTCIDVIISCNASKI